MAFIDDRKRPRKFSANSPRRAREEQMERSSQCRVTEDKAGKGDTISRFGHATATQASSHFTSSAPSQSPSGLTTHNTGQPL